MVVEVICFIQNKEDRDDKNSEYDCDVI